MELLLAWCAWIPRDVASFFFLSFSGGIKESHISCLYTNGSKKFKMHQLKKNSKKYSDLYKGRKSSRLSLSLNILINSTKCLHKKPPPNITTASLGIGTSHSSDGSIAVTRLNWKMSTLVSSMRPCNTIHTNMFLYNRPCSKRYYLSTHLSQGIPILSSKQGTFGRESRFLLLVSGIQEAVWQADWCWKGQISSPQRETYSRCHL